eukprot:4006073-Pleurochrysis_carterae.AAC.1
MRTGPVRAYAASRDIVRRVVALLCVKVRAKGLGSCRSARYNRKRNASGERINHVMARATVDAQCSDEGATQVLIRRARFYA